MKKETIEKAAKTKLNYTWSNPILTVEISIHTGKDSPQTKTTMKQEIISDKAQDCASRLYAENEYPTTHSDVELDVETAFADGARWRTAATAERAQDLMIATEHHVGYINVYSHPESKSYWTGNVFDTKEDAYENIRPISDAVVVATVKIEWEE